MYSELTDNKVFEKIDYSEINLIKGEYDNCTFINCNFYNSDLSGIIFTDCKFESCDLSLANLKNTLLNDIRFVSCKLMGLRYEDCKDTFMSVYFDRCYIKLSTFYKLNLKKTIFKHCDLQESDFTETNLTGSVFEDCNLQRTVFQNTNLEKADLSTSVNYSIDPEMNRIKKARFSAIGIAGLLDKYDIEII